MPDRYGGRKVLDPLDGYWSDGSDYIADEPRTFKLMSRDVDVMKVVIGANAQGSVPETDIKVIKGKGKTQLEDRDQQASPQPVEEYDLLYHCE